MNRRINMLMKGYEIIKDAVENDTELCVDFFDSPKGKIAKKEYRYAMDKMHMVGSCIDENTPLCTFKDIGNGRTRMIFTKEAIKELYDNLKKEGFYDKE